MRSSVHRPARCRARSRRRAPATPAPPARPRAVARSCRQGRMGGELGCGASKSPCGQVARGASRRSPALTACGPAHAAAPAPPAWAALLLPPWRRPGLLTGCCRPPHVPRRSRPSVELLGSLAAFASRVLRSSAAQQAMAAKVAPPALRDPFLQTSHSPCLHRRSETVGLPTGLLGTKAAQPCSAVRTC